MEEADRLLSYLGEERDARTGDIVEAWICAGCGLIFWNYAEAVTHVATVELAA